MINFNDFVFIVGYRNFQTGGRRTRWRGVWGPRFTLHLTNFLCQTGRPTPGAPVLDPPLRLSVCNI